ncbi:hypothetical protein [Sporohalobacter salinus]|uniref:hypothetical protein n=1 Tax=Sporohalobacter salinus TaxID=1494606 RepID=UPI001960BC6F|nr:hypothetical protein [Sporohalobacter salinus]MBM7625071.1 hypothetical protein [Sporohalobacter salinus]
MKLPVYNIVETASATSRELEVQSTEECTLNIDAVRLRGDKCCSLGQQGDSFNFNLQISNVDNSPETNVNIVDTIIIEPEVTIQFTSFDGCEAVFADTSSRFR